MKSFVVIIVPFFLDADILLWKHLSVLDFSVVPGVHKENNMAQFL